jgi:hypothetical protein
MAKPNYAFQKRQKELAKKQKKETKRQQKAAPLADPLSEGQPPLPAESTTTA